MKDQFFDLLVQIYILGYVSGQEDQVRCVGIVRKFLIDPDFEEWVGDFTETEIENTAHIFIKNYLANRIK